MSKADNYVPSEKQISRVIEMTGGDARKLAIAYLRALRRARDMKDSFDIMDGVSGSALGVARGDLGAARKGVMRAKGVLRARDQRMESDT